ncbi:hypothetical protein ACFLX5_03080 [Chloroflexota bacterium]
MITEYFDAENRLVFATGPFAGLPIMSGARWQACGKSPAPSPERFCYCETMVKKVSFRKGFGDVLTGGLTEAAEEVGY